jgi:GntR family transcriptional regulator/MocR family aminotransferase
VNQPNLRFSIRRGHGQPAFQQVCDNIRLNITTGALKAGNKLLSTRLLAEELGISRTTVVNAYEQLVAEGYIVSRKGSGFIVCDVGETIHQPVPSKSESIENIQDKPCAPGSPDSRMFPHRQWSRHLGRVARSNPQAMVDSKHVFGDIELRSAVAGYLLDWRGVEVSPRKIVITAGSQDGIELCLRAINRGNESIGLEDPGYLPLRNIARTHHNKTRWLRIDNHGICIPISKIDEQPPAIAVLTPSYQYPLGGVMPIGRRREFLYWASENKSWIIEDDYDSEFRYAGSPIPALSSLDNMQRTLYIGSFSKIFSSGLRLGFVAIPKSQITDFEDTLRSFGNRASLIPQRALATFIQEGEFYRHLRRVRRIY